MGILPDISISKRPPRDATAAYYAAFAMRHGFADYKMRGMGIIRIPPAGAYVDHATPDTYGTTGRPSKDGSARDREIDSVKRSIERAREATKLISQLRDLHEHLRPRMKPNAAVRDALDDVETILRGGEPAAMCGGKLDVLRCLVRVLSRHA